jgi:hypothetical protein
MRTPSLPSLTKTSIASLLGIFASALVACAQGGVDLPDDPSTPPDDTGSTDDTGTNPDDTGATTNPTTTPPTDSGTTPPADTGTPADTGSPPPASGSYDYVSGLAISEVAVFQGVKVSIWKNGTSVTSRNAPVVVQRPGLVRVYVTPQAGWTAKPVTAVLTLTSGGAAQSWSDTKTLSTTSSDASLASTFSFDLPATAFNADTTAKVELTVPTGQGSSTAGSAMVGSVGLAADNPGSTIKIVFVPVKYTADGSGRLPDTSATQMEMYRQTMMKLYPARSITITQRAEWTWSKTISANGAGFDTILNSLATLRQSDKAPADTYYYAAFEPAASFASFCGSGCVAGLSTVAQSATDSIARTSTGLGYTGADAGTTMAHEIGHAHGRQHAPCQISSGYDTAYPYSGGLIGVWGYDINAKTLFSPSTYGDVMGYCQKDWVSDYTYKAFFSRMKAVTGGASVFYPAGAPTKFRMVSVSADGELAWGDEIEPVEPPVGELTTLRYVSEDGSVTQTATGHFYGYSDLPGGFLLVPVTTNTSWRTIEIDHPAVRAHVLAR